MELTRYPSFSFNHFKITLFTTLWFSGAVLSLPSKAAMLVTVIAADSTTYLVPFLSTRRTEIDGNR